MNYNVKLNQILQLLYAALLVVLFIFLIQNLQNGRYEYHDTGTYDIILDTRTGKTYKTPRRPKDYIEN